VVEPLRAERVVHRVGEVERQVAGHDRQLTDAGRQRGCFHQTEVYQLQAGSIGYLFPP
jgi:hypothetical protein